jgi:type III secretion protein V
VIAPHVTAAAPKGARQGALELARRGDVRGLFLQHADILLAGLVVSIVGMMIIPLPTPLLDILITLNITISLVVLLVALYLPDATRFPSFPTVLLVTTLFRLGLNVSSTRLILLQADAGAVIRSFGEFVVKGDYVVGAVVFLVLTIVQFIVIAKGGERVAEVAARFALDAMPGKQMSIDADLRSGALDLDEARRRRRALERESQLYGAMDGAMKFVKGDAVAGIVIVAVNIVGGLAIGTLRRGLDVGDAARVYTLLTIGDGLVSQIPALLVSAAAGLVVTRVAGEEEGANLGRDIGSQVLAHPKAMAIAAGLLACLGAVPGLPAAPFVLMALLCGGAAWSLLRVPREGAGRAPLALPGWVAGAGGDGKLLGGGGGAATGLVSGQFEGPSQPAALALELGSDLATLAEGEGPLLAERLPAERERFYEQGGVVLPSVAVRRGGPDLGPRSFRLLLAGVPVERGEAPEGTDEGGAAERIAASVAAALERTAHELVGIQETQELLDGLERTHPALVREVVPKLVSPQLLTEVLRRLVEERISIRDLRTILESLAQWAPAERDPVALTEYVRSSLRRSITYRHAGDAASLGVWLLDSEIEDAVRGAIQRGAAGSFLALEPDLTRDILEAVRRAVPAGSRAVVVTNMDIRRFVRRLVEVDHPALAVLSYQELQPDLRLDPLGRITLTH